MTRKQNSKSSDRPSSSPRTIARIAEAKLRNAARPERPALEYKLEGATTFHTDIAPDVAEILLDAFGTTSKDFLASELNRLGSQLAVGPLHIGQREMNAALAAIDGTRPEKEMGAMLASQMAATHSLAKIKRGGEQTVRVEHVHVYQGGQAIVGAVSNRKGEGGGDDEKGNQAYGTQVQRAITAAPGPALLGSNQIRDALPEAGGETQEAVPAAWRGRR